MFLGPPLPLSPNLPLAELLAHAQPPGPLGAWLRDCRHRLHVYDGGGGYRRLLVSPDLGFLLGRCSHVALRQDRGPVVLPAEVVIEWRTLQVVTATPYLPGVERLSAQFPGLRPDSSGLLVPIRTGSPEEVLAECLARGMQVVGSRVVYVGKDGKDGKRREGREGRERWEGFPS